MTGPEQAMDALDRTIADYPRRLAEATERASRAAAATVTGEDESGQVTVTVSGHGEILSVRVTSRALREWDTHQLATHVTTATNAALSRAEATLEEATATGAVDTDDESAAQLHVYEQRMDAAIDRLDRLERDLDRMLGD